MALAPFLTLPKLCMEQDGEDEAPLPHVQLSSLDRCGPSWGHRECSEVSRAASRPRAPRNHQSNVIKSAP